MFSKFLLLKCIDVNADYSGKGIGSSLLRYLGSTWRHIDFGESPERAAYRECLEETRGKCKNIKFIAYTIDYFKEINKYYVTLWFKAEWHDGEAIINSLNEVSEIKWVELGDIPKPYFLSLENFLKEHIIREDFC